MQNLLSLVTKKVEQATKVDQQTIQLSSNLKAEKIYKVKRLFRLILRY